MSSHPCSMLLTNDVEYKPVYRALVNVKRNSIRNPSEFNKALLRLAHINVYHVYNLLKFKYYEKLANYIGSDPRYFFNLMKTKKVICSKLPIVMKFSGISCIGGRRITNISKHSQSCFIQSRMSFSTDADTLGDQIEDLYGLNYANRYS